MRNLLIFIVSFLAINTYAADIVLTWDKPTEREDGSKIEQIDRFNLYHVANNVLQDVIEVPADATSFQLSEVKAGNHTFQISTVEHGLEGKQSDPITVTVNQSKPVKIMISVRVVE